MGYYTYFSVEYNDTDKGVEYGNALAQINPNYFKRLKDYSLEDLISYEEMKWYDFEKDMCALSALYPDEVFTLDGKGEESDDLWRAYFHKGKEQFCPARIIYDNFDISYFEED